LVVTKIDNTRIIFPYRHYRLMGTGSSSSTTDAERQWNSQKSSHRAEYVECSSLCVADSHWTWYCMESVWVHKMAL